MGEELILEFLKVLKLESFEIVGGPTGSEDPSESGIGISNGFSPGAGYNCGRGSGFDNQEPPYWDVYCGRGFYNIHRLFEDSDKPKSHGGNNIFNFIILSL